jgi:hypothetical protein
MVGLDVHLLSSWNVIGRLRSMATQAGAIPILYKKDYFLSTSQGRYSCMIMPQFTTPGTLRTG